MPSITRTIRRSFSGTTPILRVEGDTATLNLCDVPDWARVPGDEYTVTYTMDEGGDLLILWHDMSNSHRIAGVRPVTGGQMLIVCWLPGDWPAGARATREVRCQR